MISKGLLVEATTSRSTCSNGVSDIFSHSFPLETSEGNLELERHYARWLKSYKEQKLKVSHSACQEVFLSTGQETNCSSSQGKNETVNRLEIYRLVENKCEPDLPMLFSSKATERFKLTALMIFMLIKS